MIFTPFVGGPTYTWSAATSAWMFQSSGAGGGNASLTVSDTPPASPQPNQLWWESDSGALYLYYADADSSQWIMIAPGGYGTPTVAADLNMQGYSVTNALNITATGTITAPTHVANAVSFPAAQVSNAGVNVLDDYEEGTYTPVLTAQTGAITAYTSAGSYTKIGRVVYTQIYFTVTTNGTGGGSLRITIPPFTPVGGPFFFYGRENAAVGKMIEGILSNGGTFVDLFNYDNTYPGANGYAIGLSGFYWAAT